jgi:DNA-binding NarL/FixJ family response regulator
MDPIAGQGRAMPAEILVVDEHPIVRLAVRQMIGAQPDLQICAEADSAQAALAAAHEANPHLAIVDLSLGSGTDLQLIRDLRVSSPNMRVLVFSIHDEKLYAERVLRAAARGYIMKHQAATGLVDAVRTVRDGRIYVSEAMSQTILKRLEP